MRQRPLLLLTTTVLAAHVALLAWPGMQEMLRSARITGSSPKELRFETRQITPEPPAPPAPADPPRVAAAPKPPKAQPPKPAPPPKVEAQKAPPEQAPPSLAVVGPTQTISKPSNKALDSLLDSADHTDSTSEAPKAQEAEEEHESDAPMPGSTETSLPMLASAAGKAAAAEEDAAAASPGNMPEAPSGIGSPGYNAALPPVRVPPSAVLQFEAKGAAKGFQYSAKAKLSFKTDGLSYQAKQEVSAFLVGSRAQTSSGRITPHGLAPQRFIDQARKERSAQIDSAQGRISYSGDNEAQPISAGVQDRLSIFLQLASMIAAGPERYPKGSSIAINVTSASSTDVWTFVVEGPETLELPAGSKQTLRLSRQPRKQQDQSAHLWLAPDMQYLPVRIRLEQANGDFADLQLQSAEVSKTGSSAPAAP